MGRPKLKHDPHCSSRKIVRNQKTFVECTTCGLTKVNTRRNRFAMKIHVGKHVNSKDEDPCPGGAEMKCFNKTHHVKGKCHISMESGYLRYGGIDPKDGRHYWNCNICDAPLKGKASFRSHNNKKDGYHQLKITKTTPDALRIQVNNARKRFNDDKEKKKKKKKNKRKWFEDSESDNETDSDDEEVDDMDVTFEETNYNCSCGSVFILDKLYNINTKCKKVTCNGKNCHSKLNRDDDVYHCQCGKNVCKKCVINVDKKCNKNTNERKNESNDRKNKAKNGRVDESDFEESSGENSYSRSDSHSCTNENDNFETTDDDCGDSCSNSYSSCYSDNENDKLSPISQRKGPKKHGKSPGDSGIGKKNVKRSNVQYKRKNRIRSKKRRNTDCDGSEDGNLNESEDSTEPHDSFDDDDGYNSNSDYSGSNIARSSVEKANEKAFENTRKREDTTKKWKNEAELNSMINTINNKTENRKNNMDDENDNEDDKLAPFAEKQRETRVSWDRSNKSGNINNRNMNRNMNTGKNKSRTTRKTGKDEIEDEESDSSSSENGYSNRGSDSSGNDSNGSINSDNDNIGVIGDNQKEDDNELLPRLDLHNKKNLQIDNNGQSSGVKRKDFEENSDCEMMVERSSKRRRIICNDKNTNNNSDKNVFDSINKNKSIRNDLNEEMDDYMLNENRYNGVYHCNPEWNTNDKSHKESISKSLLESSDKSVNMNGNVDKRFNQTTHKSTSEPEHDIVKNVKHSKTMMDTMSINMNTSFVHSQDWTNYNSNDNSNVKSHSSSSQVELFCVLIDAFAYCLFFNYCKIWF